MENILTLITHHNDFIQSLIFAYAAGNFTLILAIAGAGYKIISDTKQELKERADEMSERFSQDIITAMNIIHDVNEDSKEQTGNIIRNTKDIEGIKRICDERHKNERNR